MSESMKILLSQGGEAIIDAEDFNRVSEFNWFLVKSRGSSPRL